VDAKDGKAVPAGDPAIGIVVVADAAVPDAAQAAVPEVTAAAIPAAAAVAEADVNHPVETGLAPSKDLA
jgi:hypothetical protein